MKKSVLILLSALSFATFNLASNAAETSSLKFANSMLNSDLKTADPYILKVLAEHESEFPGAIRYSHLLFYTPLNRLARVQQKVLLALHEETGFARLWRAKKELSTITATVVESSQSSEPVRVLNSITWSDYKRNWVYQWSRKIGYSTPNQVLESIFSELNSLIIFMKQKDEVTNPDASDFYAARSLLSTYVIVGNLLKSQRDLTIKGVEEAIYNLEVGALDYLHDPAAFKDELAKLIDPALGEKILKIQYERVLSRIYSESKAEPMHLGMKLTLKEVHPNIAIFRGYVGNDCSTSFSPGYVFTPSDRYYYIFNEEGTSLGYLGLTLVTIDKKPAVFVHTIQGPDISSRQTELVMRAMTLAAPEIYKTDLVVLGPNDSIGSNVNFYPIRDAMFHAVAGKPELRMKFSDQKMRDIIVRYESTMTYDNPERNHSGRKLEFKNPQLVKIEVTSRPFEAKFQRPLLQLSGSPAGCEAQASRR